MTVIDSEFDDRSVIFIDTSLVARVEWGLLGFEFEDIWLCKHLVQGKYTYLIERDCTWVVRTKDPHMSAAFSCTPKRDDNVDMFEELFSRRLVREYPCFDPDVLQDVLKFFYNIVKMEIVKGPLLRIKSLETEALVAELLPGDEW